jgi:hypothetical protein
MSDYCISITKCDKSITVSYHAISLTTVSVSIGSVISLSRYISDYCISITRKSGRSITVIYHAMPLTTVSVSRRRVIRPSQWIITLCLTTASVSRRRVIRLLQWFITLCLWLLHQYHKEELYIYSSHLSCYVSDYCISITKKSDKSFTVSYHGMSLTTVSVSQRSEIGLSQWVVMLCLWLLYQYHKEVW